MQLPVAQLFVLPVFVFSVASYSAPVTRPASEVVNGVVAANPDLGNFGVSFEQLSSMSSIQAGTTLGLPKSFSELLPSSKQGSIPIADDRADSREGTVLLSLLATAIPLFGLMALPVDQRYMYRMAPGSHRKVQRSDHR
jgi:hypothetical protein